MSPPLPRPAAIDLPESVARDVALAALAARVRAGDEAAFEELFRACFARLATLAFAFVKSREVAEELVQDTLLRVWRERATWDVRGSVRAYLYAALRHRAISHLRKAMVQSRLQDEAVAVSLQGGSFTWAEGGTSASPLPAADARVEAEELRVAIGRAVAELPDRCREAFVLARQHELSHAEVAAIMGTSVRTVENHVAKARAHLRVRLAAWLSG